VNENIYFAAFFLPAAAAVLIFFMKYVSGVLQARVRMDQDEAYRDIAAKAAASHAETAAALAQIQVRLGAIEKILKDVG
jgi:uncharacterized protein YfeS